MRIHELLNTKPLIGVSEATPSGSKGTEATRKPYKPYGPCKARKPRKPYITEDAPSDAAVNTTIVVEGHPQKMRFKDFLFRLAEVHNKASATPRD